MIPNSYIASAAGDSGHTGSARATYPAWPRRPWNSAVSDAQNVSLIQSLVITYTCPTPRPSHIISPAPAGARRDQRVDADGQREERRSSAETASTAAPALRRMKPAAAPIALSMLRRSSTTARTLA